MKNGKKIQADPLFKELMSIYFQQIEAQTGIKPQIDASDGKGLKAIIKYFRSVSSDENMIINTWKAIFENYSRWDKFYQKQLRLRQINSNLTNIINSIKNGTQSATTPKSIEQQGDDIINSPEWRNS